MTISPAVTAADTARLIELTRAMTRIRAFEEAAERGQREGLVRGAIHLSIGQEAVAAGICLNLRRDDIILSTHRGHGHTIAKGADTTAMMRELFGRAGGTCQGKGGSMHIADFGVGMLGANGVVAANLVIAAGAAHAIKLQGEDRIVACFFGDGAINRGPFLEALNWSSAYKLPVLWICEDNTFAATTRTTDHTAGAGPAARAESLGIPARTIEVDDVAALDRLAVAEIATVRSGAGPRLIHARTYRLKGHTAADAAPYRDPAEVKRRWGQDPLARAEASLASLGVPAADIAGLRAAAAAEMETAFASAATAPWPETALAFADIQDCGAGQWL